MNDDTDKQTANNGSTASSPPSGSDGRDDAGRFASGNPGGPGRPAGAPNKVTASMRDLVERSVHERHPDGALAWLNSLPDAVFVRLAEKLLPRDSQLEVPTRDYQINIIKYGDLPADQRSLREAPDDGEAKPPSLT